MRTKFDKDSLAVEQSNYLNKVLNDYIFYELNGLPINPTNNLKFKSWLFGATNIVQNSNKEKSVYSGYEITIDNASFWNFDNDTARNVIIFWCW